MADQPIQLISSELCPYVQRAAITLLEKGVPFERIHIDLTAKPSWFKRLSPLGKVPLLRVGDEVLFESMPIVEYIEESYPPQLHAPDPITRARDRAWIEFGSTILADIWSIETTADRQTFDTKLALVRSKFERLESQLSSGPFFRGAGFSIVDAVYAPIFRYFDVFETIAPMRPSESLPRINDWRSALRARASVQQAVDYDYAERLIAFVFKHNGSLAKIARNN